MPDKCPRCGSKYIQTVKGDLSKCMVCGCYVTVPSGNRGVIAPKLEVISRAEEVKQLATQSKSEFLSLSGGMWKFVNAVANKLSYAPNMRKHFREGLIEVLTEKRTMEDWLMQAGVETGKKRVDLIKLVNTEFAAIPEAVAEAGTQTLINV